MAHGRIGSKLRAHGRLWLWMLVCLMAILPRTAGAFVLHAHDGHGLHMHVVSGLENQEKSLDRDVFHARHHAHAHGEEADALGMPHEHHGGEIFLGLPSEPVRHAAVATHELRPIDRVAPFFAARPADGLEFREATVDRSRPPIPRGLVARSGTRVLLRTSSALLL